MNWLKRWLSSEPETTPIPEVDWTPAEAGLDFLDRLDPAARERLRVMALTFLQRKEFAGAHGLEVSTAMRLSIALQACLPVLELGLDAYAGWIGIVVYPGDFVIPRSETDDIGVVHEYGEPALGAAMEGGPVLISWFEDRDDYEGANVVIHEFAHKLDMLSGEADGCPPLHGDMSIEEWDAAFGEAYEDFCDRLDAGEETDIDPYAGEAPAEFFAVLSEVFFVDPELLIDEYPAVYEQLRRFYRQDPALRARA